MRYNDVELVTTSTNTKRNDNQFPNKEIDYHTEMIEVWDHLSPKLQLNHTFDRLIPLIKRVI